MEASERFFVFSFLTSKFSFRSYILTCQLPFDGYTFVADFVRGSAGQHLRAHLSRGAPGEIVGISGSADNRLRISMISRTYIARALLIALPGWACGSSRLHPQCSPTEIAGALQSAHAGDTVFIGACTAAVTLTVPPGVTLTGELPGPSILQTASGAPVIMAGAGQGSVHLTDLTIETSGRAGIVSTQGAELIVEHVAIHATRGIGLGVEGSPSVRLDSVELTGPVTEQNADSMGSVTSTESATHGVVLIRVSSGQLSSVNVSGFASYGALFVGSDVTWTNGGASNNLGVGLSVEGGHASLQEIDLHQTLQGFRLLTAFNGVFSSSAAIESSNLHVTSGQGYGLFHDTGSARHIGLDAHDNHEAAVWAQKLSSLEISGALTTNTFAGIVAVNTGRIAVHDTTISGVHTATSVFEMLGAIHVGDGIQLVRSTDMARFTNLNVDRAERVGILVDLDGGMLSSMIFDNVSVTVTSTTVHAVVAQNGIVDPMGWDSGVTRHGTDRAADQHPPAFQTVSIVGPCDLPRPSELSTHGLGNLIGM
jgi:hypothetical protein